ncbi:MAG: TonB-dependent receptor plug domain-containing protein, partial [Gammaproteobacteria bacterium]|nr:TonB-dependent receptor plug domain-containing protein [Gammaproteobacteria bacterium]
MRRAMSPLRAGGRIRGAHMPLAALVLAAALAPDQAAAETASDGAHSLLEEIIVTGSRIRRDALTARDWVLHVDGDDRDRSGLSSLGDLLARLPVSGSPLSTRFNSSGVSGATDLNTIPASVVERVEVLRDGASAIYGSDAVAGVVNVITRKVRGVTARAHRGGFENGGETTDLELALGGAWGATSASAHIAHTDQARVRAADHEQTRWPKPGTGVLHGSTFTPQGRVVFADPNTGRFVNCALNDGVTGVPVYDPADPCGPGDDYHPWSNADRFNYATYNLVLTPSTRTGIFGRVEHETAAGTRLRLRAFFNRRESVNQAAPEPVWAGTLGETGSLMDDIVIDADNPYNPFGFDVGPGGFLTRRPLESGPRIFEQDVDTRYAAFTMEGVSRGFGRAWLWDASLVWSRNVAEQTKHGAHNARRMLLALGPPEGCAGVPGCVPLNLLGGRGTITDAMLDWIGFVQEDSSAQTLRSFVANVTGELASLPAGALDFAAGFERREQDGRFDPDRVVAAGDTAR